MNLDQAKAEYDRLSALIEAANDELVRQGQVWAKAENTYRKAKPEAWARCPSDNPGVKAGEREWVAERRKAWVDAETADLRYQRDLADVLKFAAWQASESRRSQLSGLQTLLRAYRAEAEFVRTGSDAA